MNIPAESQLNQKMLYISRDLAQVLVNYLGTKPHNEVTGLINELTRLQPAVFPPMPPGGLDGGTGHNGSGEDKDPAKSTKKE